MFGIGAIGRNIITIANLGRALHDFYGAQTQLEQDDAVKDYFDTLRRAGVDATSARGADPEAAADLSRAMASYALQPEMRPRSGRNACRYGEECRLVHSVLHRRRFDHPDPIPLEAFQPFVVMAQEQGGIPESGHVLDRSGRWIGHAYTDTPFVQAINLAKDRRLEEL